MKKLQMNEKIPDLQEYGKGGGGALYEELITASPRILRMRERYFNLKAMLCIERARIVHQYYSDPKNESRPLILQRAEAFRAVLDKVPIDIYQDELLVGNLASGPRSFPIIPETLGDLISSELDSISVRDTDPLEISESGRKELQETILPFWKGKSPLERLASLLSPLEMNYLFADSENLYKGTGIMSATPVVHGTGGHLTMDFPALIKKGFQGIKQEAVSHRDKLDPMNAADIEKSVFYQAVIECCEAMTAFGLRFSKLAAERASKESDPARREELDRISRICARVPAQPAENFYEALQSVWFAYIGILQEDYDRCCSLGRIDSYLYPFYKREIEAGDLTEAEVQDLLDCLWLKLGVRNFINGGAYTKLVAGFPVQQQIPVGGQTPEGEDATNPLTLQCIQATMNTRMNQPSLSVRLHKDSPPELFQKAAELVRMGTGHPSFFNDEVIVPGLVGDGIAIGDARDYSPVGCVGVQVAGCGKGSHNGGYLNAAAALEFALTNGYWRHGKREISIATGDPVEFGSFDELFSAFEAQFRHIVSILLGVSLKAEYMHEQSSPTPYISCLTEGCMENGLDRTRGSARYNLGLSFRSVGLADVADSLAAIKKFVFEDKTISMAELLKALEDDFQGHEPLRQTLLTRTPRYGNGDDYADEIAKKVLWVLTDEFKKHKSYYGGAFQPGYGSVSAHWPFGAVLGAFPDGRRAGEPLTDGIGPAHRHTQKGPTALLTSVGEMDHEKLTGGSILNLKFPPDVVKGEQGLANLVGILKSFVELGVFHCQFNIFDAEAMRAAQKNPENYRDLLVRVAGYSAFFTRLPKILQDDIIARTEHRL